jgi:hypothetical protein
LNARTYRWLDWLAGTRDERVAALRGMSADPGASWVLRKPVEALARLDAATAGETKSLLEEWDREAPVVLAPLQPADEAALREKSDALLSRASLAAASEADTAFGRVRRKAIEDAAEAVRSALNADAPAELELSVRRLEAALDAASGGSTGLGAAPDPPLRDAEFEIAWAQFGSISMAILALAGGIAVELLNTAGLMAALAVSSLSIIASLFVRREDASFPIWTGGLGLAAGALSIGLAGLVHSQWLPILMLGCLAAALMLGGFAGVHEAKLLRPQYKGERLLPATEPIAPAASAAELRSKAESLLARASLIAASEPDTAFGRLRRKALEDAAAAVRRELGSDGDSLALRLHRLESTLSALAGGGTGLNAAPAPQPEKTTLMEKAWVPLAITATLGPTLLAFFVSWNIARPVGFFATFLGGFAAFLVYARYESKRPVNLKDPSLLGITSLLLIVGLAGLVDLIVPGIRPMLTAMGVLVAFTVGAAIGKYEAGRIRERREALSRPGEAQLLGEELKERASRLLAAARAYQPASDDRMDLVRAETIRRSAEELERALTAGNNGQIALAEQRLERLLAS